MHSQQKAAWFVLIVIGGTFALYAAALPLFSWWFHRTVSEVAAPALGLFGLLGLTGLANLSYSARGGRNQMKEPVMDERDWQLSTRAWSAGMSVFWLLFCIAGIGTWACLYYLRGLQQVTVPVWIFPAMIGAGGVIFLVTRSVATLHFYGWNAGDAGR